MVRGALIAAAGAVIFAVGAMGVQRFWQGEPLAASPTRSVSASASEEPTATPTPTPSRSASPTASESPTPPAPLPTETAPPPAAETTPPVPQETVPAAVPGQVTVVTAGPGGGSGETLVNWNAVPDAIGYRVYRSSTPSGPFVAAASVTAATGATIIEFGGSYEYIQIWKPSSTAYEYVEAVDNARAYFRVAAFNAGGTGPLSGVVCGSPPTAAEGC